MKILSILTGFTLISIIAGSEEIDSQYLQCLVCRTAINELDILLAKIDPKIEVVIGNYRLDADGNTIQKKVPKSRSEVYISDALDSICEKLSDYVRAKYKSNGTLTILNLLSPSGGMNPEISNVDIIQDSDLNKSLEFHCEGILEEYQESIISVFKEGGKNAKRKICTHHANLCSPDDFVDEDDIDLEAEEKSDVKDEL